MNSKVYIGDGVYADFDGDRIVLSTENGIETTNRIVLEPEVYLVLTQYVKVTAHLKGAASGRAHE